MSDFNDLPVIVFNNTNIYHDEMLVLKKVSFTVQKGDFVYIIGQTGSGKTSLLKSMYADQTSVEGEVFVCGHKLHSIKSSEVPFLRRKIGIVFQDFQLLNDRTVQENLIFVMKATGWSDPLKMKAKVNELLMRVGLSSVASKYPHQLSGGEQQRIVIARALINEPLVLIADEPTGNLDPVVADSIMKLFIEINKSGTTIVMATHHLSFLEKYPRKTLKVSHSEVAFL